MGNGRTKEKVIRGAKRVAVLASFGLFPIMFESSLQAQIIIPMALSLAFGIMFATVITLFLIPSLYMILEDFKSLIRGKKKAPAKAEQSLI